ncbi:MAG: hypothetical protein ABIU54_05395 [Candidatus Eisenbacteria bacterium]
MTEWVGRRSRLLLALGAALVLVASAGPEDAPPPAADPDATPDAFTAAHSALLAPFTTRAFHIDPQGQLDDGAVVLSFSPRAGDGVARGPQRIAYEARWLPIVRWTRYAGGVRYQFEAVALPLDAPRESVLVSSIQVRVANMGSVPATASLDLALSYPLERRTFVAFDRSLADSTASFVMPGVRQGRAWTDAAPAAGEAHWNAQLAPNESRGVRVVLSTYTLDAKALRAWARTGHAARVAESRRYWAKQLEPAVRFHLNDPETEAALKAAWVVLLSCRERCGGQVVPIGGPFHYRDVRLREGARAISALAVSGFTTEAMELANGLTSVQWPDGAFLSQRGQLDGVGQAPWAFAEAALRRAPDTSGVQTMAASAVAAWRWCERGRAIGRATGWSGGTLLPVADARDNELIRAQLVGNDAWALAGYTAAARLTRAAGWSVVADSIELSRAAYLTDFNAALTRSGSPDVPPSWQGRGRDWGNLAVAWPCRVLGADDPRMARLAARMWARAKGAGLTMYAGSDMRHGYAGAELGTWALLARRRAEADAVLASLLHWRSASGAGCELFTMAGDPGDDLPPHPGSAAALVAQVRNSLVFDDGDTLRLALGARDAWWKGGRVQGLPTRFGTIDLALNSTDAAVEAAWTPVSVWSELALPRGRRLAGPVTSPLVAGPGGLSVLAPPGIARVRVTTTKLQAPR